MRHRSTPRVLSLPADHAYIRHALPADGVLAAPVSLLQARGWEPHPAFAPGWLDQHAQGIDLVHLHFGYDSLSLRDLRRWLSDLERLGLPLVLTVHDLRNPHHGTPDIHDGQLRLLLAAAADVVTLTQGAAGEIHLRSGRRSHVIAHPRVLRAPAPRVTGSAVVGIVLKARAQVVEPDRVVAAALWGTEQAGAGTRLRVDAHPAVLPRLPWTVESAAAGHIDLHVGERFSEAGFAAYLSGLTVSVLPYRFGTHSGWLEACRDAGARVVAPDCGYYADQWAAVTSYGHNERRGLDDASLAAAVVTALSAPRLAPAERAERERADAESVERHRGIWRAVLAQGSTLRAA